MLAIQTQTLRSLFAAHATYLANVEHRVLRQLGGDLGKIALVRATTE